MREIKTYFKGAPFHNAFIKTWPANVLGFDGCFPATISICVMTYLPFLQARKGDWTGAYVPHGVEI
jgi:hypothetical protein